jgi:signal transduction histidine kinase
MGREVQLALEETGKLAHRIYPPLLEAGGLRAALRAAALSAGVSASIEVETETRYPPEIAGAVYFCCLEVLERAREGARATIDVRVDGDAVRFEVAGNDAAGSGDGLGHLGDHVVALGGRLTVESEPGGGTRVSGSLPLSR